MAVKVPIDLFVAELKAACERHDGYIMGARGENPRTGRLDLSDTNAKKSWGENGYYFNQYQGDQRKKALYWRDHAKRVWDCNGLAEGIYEICTGLSINTQARNNYANWCNPKGSGVIPKDKRVPGAAVFIYSAKAGYITHVGYLERPVEDGKPDGDWFVIEAKGVMYGVVRTRLLDRGWNRRGWMTVYFDYQQRHQLRRGDEGADVKRLQNNLISCGIALPKFGADGDFGTETESAVKTFQKMRGLPVTGIADEMTLAAIDALCELAEGQGDLEAAVVELAEIIGGVL